MCSSGGVEKGMDKQIFAALEIADHEVRLLVGEFFNTRFNIIKVERVPVAGVQFHQLTEPNEVVKAIRRAAEKRFPNDRCSD